MNTDNLNVNDTVYGSFGRYGRVDVRKGTIINKSATGIVKVRFSDGSERSFLQHGRERGGDRYHAAQLINEETYQRSIVISNRAKAARAANSEIENLPKFISPSTANAATQAKIIAALEEALALVRAVPVMED